VVLVLDLFGDTGRVRDASAREEQGSEASPDPVSLGCPVRLVGLHPCESGAEGGLGRLEIALPPEDLPEERLDSSVVRHVDESRAAIAAASARRPTSPYAVASWNSASRLSGACSRTFSKSATASRSRPSRR